MPHSIITVDWQEYDRLRDIEGLSLTQAAKRLGISQPTLSRRVAARKVCSMEQTFNSIPHDPEYAPSDDLMASNRNNDTVDTVAEPIGETTADAVPDAIAPPVVETVVEPTADTMPEDAVEALPGQLRADEVNTPAEVRDSVSTRVDLDQPGHLSPVEAQSLDHYEQIIAQGIQTFIEVGHALMAIRDQRLYRQVYGTFEDYLRQRWDLSRPRAYQLIDAAQVVDTVSTSVDIVPVNEAQARPLASLPPEQQRAVWQAAVDTAPPSGITAKHVQATVKRVKASPTGTVPRRGQAEETRERMGERGQPNGSWINVLSQAHRLCSSLARLPDRDEVFTSWGSAGRQKAIEYLEPLYKDIDLLLQHLTVMEGHQPFANE